MEFGFTCCGDEGGPKPQCLVLRIDFEYVYETHDIETTLTNESRNYENNLLIFYLCAEKLKNEIKVVYNVLNVILTERIQVSLCVIIKFLLKYSSFFFCIKYN